MQRARLLKSDSFVNSVRHAVNGFFAAVLFERNFRFQVIVGGVVLVLSWYLGVSLLEFLILLLAGALVLVCELMNSALEALADAVHPDFHEFIRQAKDMSAAGVLLASLTALIVGAVILVPVIRTFFFI